MGETGRDRSWELSYWLWPLPPPGPLALVVEWPAAGIPLSRTEIDASQVIEAAAEAEELWPAERAADQPVSGFLGAAARSRSGGPGTPRCPTSRSTSRQPASRHHRQREYAAPRKKSPSGAPPSFFSSCVVATRRGTDVHMVACRPNRLRISTGSVAGGAEPVRQPGVELGDLAGPHEVVVAEDQPQPAGEDVEPLVALVGAGLRLARARAG